jgi:hypothetical protein
MTGDRSGDIAAHAGQRPPSRGSNVVAWTTVPSRLLESPLCGRRLIELRRRAPSYIGHTRGGVGQYAEIEYAGLPAKSRRMHPDESAPPPAQ